MSLRLVAQWNRIGSVHHLIIITSQQPNRTILCYKTFFYTGLQPSGTVPATIISCISKTYVKFVKGINELIGITELIDMTELISITELICITEFELHN